VDRKAVPDTQAKEWSPRDTPDPDNGGVSFKRSAKTPEKAKMGRTIANGEEG